MKIDDKCYAVIISTSEKRVRNTILRYKLKRLGFVKNDSKFMKIYGLEGRDNCEVWSRSLKKHKAKQGDSDAKGA